ncbi:3-keto-disaccharide hydrolase [Winogradskyella alexanderae]|uniref:DUF1080 domain-containing protein n=1 Tax=Winogradskyella alexanderae TaxID=2877123 RepID=A0ABS7XSR0_9FLAO|nr:DUF1080 domain-containing protein [Winogradskyella alexanderae]MCA0132494.1 DUF1080 domain-containing protein [Winogradskyella alexanderae]
MNKLYALSFILILVMSCKETAKEIEVETEENEITETMSSEVKEEWISLFDGKSLEKWRGYLSEDMYPEWTVEDGAMAFTPGPEGGKNIITKKTFTNFILSLEWKVSEGGNSGIFWGVHEDEKFKEAYMTGPEIQVLDNERHPDSFVANGTHKAGSLYDMIGCPDEHINPAGEWNLCVIEVNQNANLAKVSMNGTQVMEFPLHGEGWDKMVANSKFKDWEGFGKYKTGHIGLQDHSDKVWFKNIKIKEL